jgi:hypothetical protein
VGGTKWELTQFSPLHKLRIRFLLCGEANLSILDGIVAMFQVDRSDLHWFYVLLFQKLEHVARPGCKAAGSQVTKALFLLDF